MKSLKDLVGLLDTSKLKNLPSSQKGLLKDLCGSHQASNHYSGLLEGTCDDLLEAVDKKIDLLGKKSRKEEQHVIQRDMPVREFKMDRQLAKP